MKFYLHACGRTGDIEMLYVYLNQVHKGNHSAKLQVKNVAPLPSQENTQTPTHTPTLCEYVMLGLFGEKAS